MVINLENYSKRLLENESVDTDNFLLVIDDVGRILAYKKDKNTGERKGRPLVLGVAINKNIQWAENANDQISKLFSHQQIQKQKTTIGSYVTPEEYVLVCRAAAEKSMTIGAFVRKTVLDYIRQENLG